MHASHTKNPIAGNRGGFTMVELLVVIAIIAIMSTLGVVYMGSQTRVMNTKVTDDLSAIRDALEQYAFDNGGQFPVPVPNADKNLLCFYMDTSYAHDCSKADFIQAQIDNTLLTKMYLQEVPTDPRTGSRYAYGVSFDGKYYQVAGLIEGEDGTFTAKVVDYLHFTYPVRSLIRSYNGPDFVMDGESFLPYSPDHLSVTATLADITGAVKVGDEDAVDGAVVKPGTTVTAAFGARATLYFSDGSITYLDGTADPAGASLRVLPTTDVEQNDKDGIITKIRIKIFSGKIWNKIVRLASKSEFNIETTGAIAGVRGTEFGITAKSDPTYPELIVLSGAVSVRDKENLPVTGSGPDDYLDIDFMDVYEANPGQTAHGNGTLDHAVFEIPEGNATLPTLGAAASLSEQNDIKNNYYRQPYNNNLRPHLNEIDVALNKLSFRLFEKGANNPFDFQELKKVRVYQVNKVGEILPADPIEWSETDFTLSPAKDFFTLNNPAPFFTEVMDKTVILIYEDESGHLSGSLYPALRIRNNAQFTWDMLFGDWTSGEGVQPSFPQVAITTPSSNILLGDSFPYSSNIPCKWTIETGSGELSATMGQNITYKSIKEGMTLSALIADITTRFDNSQTNLTTIRCKHPTDPNPNNKSEVSFYVNYSPYKVADLPPPSPPPNGSGYRYSYFAGKKTWDEADQACMNLKEGGLTWYLPSKGNTSKGIDIADGSMDTKTSLTEIGLTCELNGNNCSDTTVFGTNTGAVWLKDASGGQALAAIILNQLLSSFNKTTPLAFRCVVAL